jgi:hypothetical protein
VAINTLSVAASLSTVIRSSVHAQQAEGTVLVPGFKAADLPTLDGRIVVITGGNGAQKTIQVGPFSARRNL